MWNDHETSQDLFGYIGLAKTICGLLSDKNLSPLTVGVFGDWGAGKSSILKMVENQLEENKEYQVVKYNGWLFQGYEDTKSTLMENIIETLCLAQPRNIKLKNKAKKLLQKVDYLKLARGKTRLT